MRNCTGICQQTATEQLQCGSQNYTVDEDTLNGSHCISSFMTLVVPVLLHSECLTDDECLKLSLHDWNISLTKIVALSEKKSKTAIATFKEAEVDPPEILLCK